jgi:hypothetical protein
VSTRKIRYNCRYLEASYSAGVGAESNGIEDNIPTVAVSESDILVWVVREGGGRSSYQWAGRLAANARNERLVIIK